MATYQAFGLYFVERDENGNFSIPYNEEEFYYARLPPNTSFFDNTADDNFRPGEELYLSTDGASGFFGLYFGFSGDGFIVQNGGLFYLISNNSGLTDGPITVLFEFFTVCFLTGTLISTVNGQKPVESLARGDLILTSDGQARPVRWIGQQTIVSIFADRLRNWPVRMVAGALDTNVPLRDLYVSPDHAILVDGLLVQAGALVNGTSITRVKPLGAKFTYYHIEVEGHVLVLAEGTPAETFVDNVSRRRFDNYAEYEAIYASDSYSIEELDLPRVKSARQLPAAIRARLEARAGMPNGLAA